MALSGQFNFNTEGNGIAKIEPDQSDTRWMLVDMLDQRRAGAPAAAAPNTHNLTFSNIKQIIRVVNILLSTSLRWITSLNTQIRGRR